MAGSTIDIFEDRENDLYSGKRRPRKASSKQQRKGHILPSPLAFEIELIELPNPPQSGRELAMTVRHRDPIDVARTSAGQEVIPYLTTPSGSFQFYSPPSRCRRFHQDFFHDRFVLSRRSLQPFNESVNCPKSSKENDRLLPASAIVKSVSPSPFCVL